MHQRIAPQTSPSNGSSRRTPEGSQGEPTLKAGPVLLPPLPVGPSQSHVVGPHFSPPGPRLQDGPMLPAFPTKEIDHDKKPSAKIDQSTQSNPWKGIRIDLIGVLLNLGTYALLMSDVPRAGVLTNLNMREMFPGSYSWFGSFAYQVITIYRDPDNFENITAVKYDNVVDHARVWSYCFDTTSVGLRTIASHFNDTDKYIINCMNYRPRCLPLTFFSTAETFKMLDRLIGYPNSYLANQLPAMSKGTRNDPYQHVRLSRVTKNRHVWILYDYLAQWFFDPIQHRLVRATGWENVDGSFDLCADPKDRPYLCDTAYADYSHAADPADAESMNVTFVWDSMNQQVHDLYKKYHNQTANTTLEVLIVEGYTEPMTYIGGLAKTVSWEFDMVLFTRIRDCSRPASKNPNREACLTTRVQDYRFEGGQLYTDVMDWNHLIEFLRISAQLYYILRVVGLILGCYYAFPVHQRSWFWAIFIFLSEVPSHVVAFGSFIPIFFYMLALSIDGTSVNAIIHSGGMGLQGNFVRAPGAVYLLICLLMRKQWLMAFLTMLWVRFQVLMGNFNRQRGITSIRGHIFGILSSMSMVVGYYNPKMRDTRVLGQSELNPDPAVLNTRLMALDDNNLRLGGFYSDLITIALSAVVYVAIVVVLRTFSNGLYQLHLLLTASSRTASQTETIQRTRASHNRIVGQRSFFACQTDCLPSTCNTLWMVEGLTCGWSSDVFISMAGPLAGHSLVEQSRREMLMNIVQMSEPLNYLRLRLGLNRQKVYTYIEVSTQRTFMTINKVSRDRMLAKENKDCEVQVVRKRNANDLAFHELVRIR